jgi:butyrate kinase
VYSVLNGMSQSSPIARHCMPQNPTHQIAMIALRSAAPVNGGFGPERVGRVPSAAILSSSISTSSTKASTSLKASHEAGEVLAVLTAVPICG